MDILDTGVLAEVAQDFQKTFDNQDETDTALSGGDDTELIVAAYKNPGEVVWLGEGDE